VFSSENSLLFFLLILDTHTHTHTDTHTLMLAKKQNRKQISNPKFEQWLKSHKNHDMNKVPAKYDRLVSKLESGVEGECQYSKEQSKRVSKTNNCSSSEPCLLLTSFSALAWCIKNP
jgi:hypothetical protein